MKWLGAGELLCDANCVEVSPFRIGVLNLGWPILAVGKVLLILVLEPCRRFKPLFASFVKLLEGLDRVFGFSIVPFLGFFSVSFLYVSVQKI